MVYFLKNDGTPAPPTGNTAQTGNAPPASASPSGGTAQAANVPAPAAAADAKQPAEDAKGAAADGKELPAAAKWNLIGTTPLICHNFYITLIEMKSEKLKWKSETFIHLLLTAINKLSINHVVLKICKLPMISENKYE